MASPPRIPSRPPISRQSGAFDLPSVLIGVAVVAILATGVLAAIFGVIPWAQDRAAKQDLAAINTAQGTTYAQAGSFTDKAALVSAGWLGSDTPEVLEAKADVEGKCYVAVTTSKTGNRFVISSDKPTPRAMTPSDTWCTGAPIMKDTAPVMITTWDTGLAETCRQITLPIDGLRFKGTVTWGDGTTDANITHTFATAGQVSIRIDGTFERWGADYWQDSGCLVSVDRWGETGTTDLGYAFQRANNLKHVESIPPTTARLDFAFHYNRADFTLGKLDTARVTDMTHMFSGASVFNQPVAFDTSKVTDMDSMFYGAAAFNQPVNFDTSQVTTMAGLFWNAVNFNQPVSFNTSKVTTMQVMFGGAAAFNQPVNFDTSKVTTMQSMFSSATAFNQPVRFSTPRLDSTYAMFADATAFNQPVELTTSAVTTMGRMFYGARAFNQPLTFDTAKVTDMGEMFRDAKAFNQPLNFSSTAQVTDMNSMFDGAGAFNQPLNFETSKVTDMRNMFDGAASFNRPLNFDTSRVEKMGMMFYAATAFNQDLSKWNVSRVTEHEDFTNGGPVWKLPKPVWVH